MLVESGGCPEGEVFSEGRCVYALLAEVDTIHYSLFSVPFLSPPTCAAFILKGLVVCNFVVFLSIRNYYHTRPLPCLSTLEKKKIKEGIRQQGYSLTLCWRLALICAFWRNEVS